MKVYFEKTDGDNRVIITNGGCEAKVFNGAPDGTYEGVDLYADNAADLLMQRFKELEESGELQSFDDIYSPNEMSFEDIKEELEAYAAEVIFENEE